MSLPRPLFSIGEIYYDEHFCTGALNAIVHLVSALYLDHAHRADESTKREMEHVTQELRLEVMRLTQRTLPPIECIWQGGMLGLRWDRRR